MSVPHVLPFLDGKCATSNRLIWHTLYLSFSTFWCFFILLLFIMVTLFLCACFFFLSIEDNQSVLPKRSIEEKYNRSRLISSFQSGSLWYMKSQLDLIELNLRVTRSRWLDNKSALPSSPALSFPLLHASPLFSSFNYMPTHAWLIQSWSDGEK